MSNAKNWFVRNMIKNRTVRFGLTEREAETLAERMNSRVNKQNKLEGTGEVCFVPDYE